MIWRRWVTESSSSAPQTSSDHLDRWFSNTRKRPPQSGLVQVGFEDIAADLREARFTVDVRTLRRLGTRSHRCRDPSTCASIRRNRQELVVGGAWDSSSWGRRADSPATSLGATNFLDHVERPYGIDNTPGTI